MNDGSVRKVSLSLGLFGIEISLQGDFPSDRDDMRFRPPRSLERNSDSVGARGIEHKKKIKEN